MGKKLLIHFKRYNGNSGATFMVYDVGANTIAPWAVFDNDFPGVTVDRGGGRVILWKSNGSLFHYYDIAGNFVEDKAGLANSWPGSLMHDNAIHSMQWSESDSKYLHAIRNFSNASLISIGTQGPPSFGGDNRGAVTVDGVDWYIVRGGSGGLSLIQRVDEGSGLVPVRDVNLFFPPYNRIDCNSLAIGADGSYYSGGLILNSGGSAFIDAQVMKVSSDGSTLLGSASVWPAVGVYWAVSVCLEPGGQPPLWAGVSRNSGTTWDLYKWTPGSAPIGPLVSVNRNDLGRPSASQLFYVYSWAWLEDSALLRPLRQRQQSYGIRQRQQSHEIRQRQRESI